MLGERRLTRRAEPFSLWNYDFSRIPSIMEQRASTYQALFFRSLQLVACSPTTRPCVCCNSAIPTRCGRTTSATSQPCAARKIRRWIHPTAVVERIAEISTRFWLASACDRQLLAPRRRH